MNEKIVYADIFKTAWKGLKSQIWLLTGLLIGYTILYSLLLLFTIPSKGEALSISSVIILCLCLLLGCLFMMGYLKNCFQTLDREEPQFTAYGQVVGKLFGFLLAVFVFYVIVAIGFALLFLPGVYLWLRLQFFFAFMVDADAGVTTSFKRSWAITKGHTLQLFVLMLIQLLISCFGIILLGIGIFVAVPLILLMYVRTFQTLIAPDTSN